MTSRPLLASVAESMVILAPIVQVGWRSACGGRHRVELGRRRVEERAARGGQDQRGDARHRLADEALPDRRMLRIDRPEPGQRARVRIGRTRRGDVGRQGPRASGITRWPPATSVSLLAVATTLPARSAARTGRRLTMPPVPTMTRSTSSRVASATSASAPADPSVPGGRSRPASAAGSRQGDGGWPQAGGLLRQQRRVPAGGEGHDLEARRGCAARTSTAWRPIEPVDPSRATRPRRALPRPAPVSGRRRGHTGSRPAPRTGTNRPGRACRRGPGSAAPSPSRRRPA